MKLMYTIAENEKSVAYDRANVNNVRFEKISVNSILREIKPLPGYSSDENSSSRSSSAESYSTN